MNYSPKNYERMTKAHAPHSTLGKNMIFAFLIGGGICAIAEILSEIYAKVFKMSPEDAGRLTSVTLVFLSVLLTGLGIYEKIAKIAGAGTLVPITGFANAVASPAIDSRAEGFVMGVGAKIFTVAGPVLLYGTLAGAIYGVVYYIVGLLS